MDFCTDSDDPHDPVAAVHRCIHSAATLLEPDIRAAGLPVRFATTKLVEDDEQIKKKITIPEEKHDAFDHLVSIMQQETGMDREAALANMRFTFLEKLCRETVVRPHESKEHKRSMAIDRLLTGKYTAIPCFLGIIALVFFLTFSVIGAALSDVMQMGIDFLTDLIDKGLTAFEINPVVHSLVIDGICAGVGSVLSFLPTIVTLFFFLSILEDTGYMARVAFVMDRPLRKLGLSGRSFVPMLMGFGCSVPAIMATRTLSSERDRKMTILLTPFMSCSAKILIYTTIAGAFFEPQYRWLVLVGLYLFGIICGILYSLILKVTVFHGEPVPFVMELPAYHLPTVGNLLRSMWERGWSFIKKAGTIILLSTILVWFTTYFGFVDGTFRMLGEDEIGNSILAAIGNGLAWIFAPLGWGNWQATVASITGLVAKENIVGTMGILYPGGWTEIGAAFTGLSGFSFLLFNLLCAPCFAAMGAIKREMNNIKWFWFAVGYQCVFAYAIAFMVFQFGSIFAGGLNVIGLIFAVAVFAFMIYMLVRPYKEATTLKVKPAKK